MLIIYPAMTQRQKAARDRIEARTHFLSTKAQKRAWEACARREQMPFGLWIRRALKAAAEKQEA